MSGLAARRGFLRSLAALPLVGGAVSILGNPTAAAEPFTNGLGMAYADWLLMERRIPFLEIFPDPAERRIAEDMWHCSPGPVRDFHLGPGHPVSWKSMPQPSTRAALVLSAVGCDWRRA